MSPAETDLLIRQLIGDHPDAAARLLDSASTGTEPLLLVAAALLGSAQPELLARAAALARTSRERQIVAIARAHLAGDPTRVDALAREHLVDHPDSLLVAWIAAEARRTDPSPARTSASRQHTDRPTQE
ncbi:MAG: hypothetical protein ACJ72G_07330 [Friedmanniella sp.]|jgi:hypothetical protein